MKRSKRLFCLWAINILVIINATAQTTLGFSLKDGKTSVVIPFESFNNLIIVPVTLNKALPLRFILDTGVQTTILTERTFSDILNIQYNRKLTLVGADGDKGVDAYVAGDISLELPGTSGEGQVMLVLEKDYLQLKNYLGEDVQGILGYEIFRRFVVEINYEEQTLTLTEPAVFKAPKKFKAIPIQIEETKPYFYGNIILNDTTSVKAKLMIDTGASHSLLLDASSHPDIKVPEPRVRCNLGRGLGGDINGYIARLKGISFDEFYFSDPISSFPDTANLGEIFKKTGRQGTMGAGILRRFTVIIDYYDSKIYLKKNDQYKVPFEYNMSGLELIATGEGLNTMVIEDVRKGSQADSVGIQAGDIIRVVNGQRAKNLDLNRINNLFRSKEGRKIKLKIERGDEILKKIFILKKLI